MIISGLENAYVWTWFKSFWDASLIKIKHGNSYTAIFINLTEYTFKLEIL